MIVGDSISQGREGDRTWRYRLWRTLVDQGTAVRFVGPWKGTWVPSAVWPAEAPAQPARPDSGRAHPDDGPARRGDGPARPGGPDDPAYAGSYRRGIHFPACRHYASWGRLLHEAKDNIEDAVAAHGPGWLMVALGFNDLAWGVSGPGRLLADMETFVLRARAADPAVQFLIGNVVHRTPLSSLPDLARDTDSYNRELPRLLAALSTDRSRAVPVDLAGVYDPHRDSYDGVHPNDSGEARIAAAFAAAFAPALVHAGGGVSGRVPALG
ncbi:GDSL-type esterase/lipase family protein [Sphaerisporangium sp. NPDC004334]